MWRKGNPCALLVGMENGVVTMESSRSFPPKLKIELPCDAGYLSEEIESTNQRRYMHPLFIATLFKIAKIWKQLKCPSIDEWIKKMYVCVYIYI